MKIAEYTIPTLTGERVVLNADFSQEVARGCAVLDQREPGWDDKIDLPQLNLDDMNQCILGQVFMGRSFSEYGYVTGLHHLADASPLSPQGERWATEHGFYTDLPHMTAELHALFDKHDIGVRLDWLYEQLALEWIAVIQARRAAKAMIEQIVPADEPTLVH